MIPTRPPSSSTLSWQRRTTRSPISPGPHERWPKKIDSQTAPGLGSIPRATYTRPGLSTVPKIQIWTTLPTRSYSGQAKYRRYPERPSIVACMPRSTFRWCLLSDWSVEPHELRDVGFLEQLGGALIWTCSDTRSTCTLSPFRLLDYAVISPSFQVLARSMTAIHDLPWHASWGSRSRYHARQRPFNAKSWHCRDHSCNRWPRKRSPTRQANVPNTRPPSRTASPSRRSGVRQARRRRPGGPRALAPLTAERSTGPHLAHLSFSPRLRRTLSPTTRCCIASTRLQPSGLECSGPQLGSMDERDGEVLLPGPTHPAAAMAGIHRPQSRSPDAQYLVGPL